jgi:hypothetical protein
VRAAFGDDNTHDRATVAHLPIAFLVPIGLAIAIASRAADLAIGYEKPMRCADFVDVADGNDQS